MTAENIVQIPDVKFDVPGMHTMKRMDVFRGSWWPRILGLLAISPILLFPIELAIFLTIGMPYFFLAATIISIPFAPVISYVLAVFWHTSIVYVWRSFHGTAVLCQEPWRTLDIGDLPAVAWQRIGDSQGLVPVIDALEHDVSESTLVAEGVQGGEFNPYGDPPEGADDELVSMVLRTEAATKVYSARQEKDRYHNFKVTGMFVIIGFLAFVIWLALSDMNAAPKVQ